MTDKMIAPGAEEAFYEHVQLIMKQDGLTEPEARLRAWMEGENRLQARRDTEDL